MNNLKKYLSTAPVLLTLWLSLTAIFLMELNNLYPDSFLLL
jgi:hypothetical protein